MATIQKRTSRGHTYWSIVESRRVNGKPRPVILEYLGTADALLTRLREGIPHKIRSYSHGAVAVLLDIAQELQVVQLINKHIGCTQLRHGFTVGGSLLLAAIGRVCHPTSKRNWYDGWAKSTSLSYILGKSLNKLDSQHFWDQMEAVPVSAISKIEEDIIKILLENGDVSFDTLLYDTSNFFTYIDSSNHRCTIAQRGKNKQKRADLRQFGLQLIVSRQDQIPLFHDIYQGNLSDKTVFREQFKIMLDRFKSISKSLEDITLVFDQGSNSKEMLRDVNDNICFVGALSPFHHKDLIREANDGMSEIEINGRKLQYFRIRKTIWNLDLTCVVYVSETLRDGQVRGLEESVAKLLKKLNELKEKIALPTKAKTKKRDQSNLEAKIASIIASYVPNELISFCLNHLTEDAYDVEYNINADHFDYLVNEWFGRRIVITNRHAWGTDEIVSAYWGQSDVEHAFKTMKNPFHTAMRPRYHWTDQKIEVHGFICVLGYLLTMVAHRRAKKQAGFQGTPVSLMEKLASIRLATFIEARTGRIRGRYMANYSLEEFDLDMSPLVEAMGLAQLILRTEIPFSVYK